MLTRSLTTTYLPSHTPQVHCFTNESMAALLHATRSIEALVSHYFAPLQALAGKAHLERTASKAVVTVPYFMLQGTGSLNANSVNLLGRQLAATLQCPVEVRLVRLQAPYLDAHVLAQFLSIELASTTFRKAMLTLFTLVGPIKRTDQAPTGALLGVKVRLAGRLLLEASRPRQTVQVEALGSFASHSLHTLQAASHTATNTKGTYTVKVWLCVKA